MSLKNIFFRVSNLLKPVFRHYPLTVSLLFLLSLSLSVQVWFPGTHDLISYIWVFLLTASVSALVTEQFILTGHGKKTYSYWLIFILFVAGFFVYYGSETENSFFALPGFVILRWFILIATLLLIFVWLYAKNRDNEIFRNRLIHLFVSLLGAGLVVILLAAGLLVLDLLLENLIFTNSRILNNTYVSVNYFVFIFLFGVLFLGLSDYSFKTENLSFVNWITAWLFPVLAWLYLSVLYLYVLKIALTGTLPKNAIAPYIEFFGIFSVIAYILAPPVKGEKPSAAPRLLPKIYFYLYLPLIFLLFYVIGIRIFQYGISISRYYGLSAGLFFLIASFLILKAKSLQLHKLLLIGISLLLISVLPFAGANDLSFYSQKHELESLFRKDGHQNNAKRIIDIIRYIQRTRINPASAFDNPGIVDLLNTRNTNELSKKLKEKYGITNPETRFYNFSREMVTEKPVPVEAEVNKVWHVKIFNGTTAKEGDLHLTMQGTTLWINGKSRFDLEKLIEKIKQDPESVENEDTVFRDGSYLLVIEEIYGTEKNGKDEVGSVNALLFELSGDK